MNSPCHCPDSSERVTTDPCCSSLAATLANTTSCDPRKDSTRMTTERMVECKTEKSLNVGLNSMNQVIDRRLTLRFLYMPVIAALLAFSQYPAVVELGQGLNGMSLKSCRRCLRKERLSDRVYKVADRLQRSGLLLGDLRSGGAFELAAPASPPSRRIVASYPTIYADYLPRNQHKNTDPNLPCFVLGTGLPQRMECASTSTPVETVYKAFRFGRG